MSPATRAGRSPGLTVVVALAVLTVVEYLVSAADVPALLLWLLLFAVGKAAVIVYAFMHLPEVFGEESR